MNFDCINPEYYLRVQSSGNNLLNKLKKKNPETEVK